MPKFAFSALLVVLALGLGACGVTNRAITRWQESRAPELPAPEWDKVDGDYKGSAGLVAAQSPNCPPGGVGVIEIGDQTLYFAYSPNVIFIAPIQPDGSLHARSGNFALDGLLTGGRLVFTVRTPACQSQFDVRYVL